MFGRGLSRVILRQPAHRGLLRADLRVLSVLTQCYAYASRAAAADSVSAAGTGSGAATGAVSPGAGAGADATVEPAAALVTAIKTGEQTQRTKMDGTRSSIALTSFSKDNIGVVADADAAAADDDTGAGIAGDKASTAVDEADAVENEATATKDGTLTPSAAQQESTAADSDQDDGADNA